MATVLSQHSSNPLECATSDAQNRAYLKRYNDARAGHSMSSDDPLNSYHMPELQEYNISPHSETKSRPEASRKSSRKMLVDEDEDMESEDELTICPLEANDDESPSGVEVDMDEEEEEVEEVVEDDEDDDDDEAEAEDAMDVLGEDTDDEELTLQAKSPEEREEIIEEIADLEDAVPQLTQDYKLLDRLGTGTFSSVYKAIDLWYHDKWDNTPWQGHHPPSSSASYQSAPRPPSSKVYVAIKRIYVTSSPERIRNEIAILEDCRGCRHVSQLITAFRQEDQVVAIMPYHRNDDFRVSKCPCCPPNATAGMKRRNTNARCPWPVSRPISAVCSARCVIFTRGSSSIAM